MRLTVHMSLFSFKLVRRITDYTWHLENSSCQNCQSVGDWFLSITCRTKKLRDRKDLWGHATHFKPHSISKFTCSNQQLRAQGKFIIIFCWCNRKDEEEQHLFVHSIISLIYSTTFPPPSTNNVALRLFQASTRFWWYKDVLNAKHWSFKIDKSQSLPSRSSPNSVCVR